MKIRPYTPEEARTWAEEELSYEEYEKEFGLVEEASEKKEVFTTTILRSTKRKLEQMKSETGKILGHLIDEIIKNI